MSTEAAESHLMRSLLEVWERVTREMEMTDAQFADHLVLAVATLPHKVLSILILSSPSRANNLFLKRYTIMKGIKRRSAIFANV